MLGFAVRLVGKESKHSAQAMTAIAIMIAMITSLFMLVSGFAGEIFALTELAGNSSYLTIMEKDRDNPETFLESQLPTSILQEMNHENIETVLAQRVKILQFACNTNESGTGNNATENTEALIWGTNLTQMLEFRSGVTIAVGKLAFAPNTLMVGQSLAFSLNITQVPFQIETSTPENRTLWITGIVQGSSAYDMDLITSEETFLEWYPTEADSLAIIEVKLRDATTALETAKEIQSALGNKGYHVVVRSQKQSRELMNKTFEDLIAMFRYLEAFLLLIVLLRIYHISSWFVMEHASEFKTLRAVGMTRTSLILTILQISFVLGNLGIFMGVIIGAVLPFTLVSGLALALNISNLYPQITIVHLGEIIVATNVAIFLGALVPAWQASRQRIAIG